MFEEKKRQITKSLIDAMRSFPPLKEDMYAILDEIEEAFPATSVLKPIMKTLGVKVK